MKSHVASCPAPVRAHLPAALGAILAAALSAGGCVQAPWRPERPEVMRGDAESGQAGFQGYSLKEFDADSKAYRDALDEELKIAASLPPAQRDAAFVRSTLYRDRIVNRIRADIRAGSGEFEDRLRERLAAWETGADISELGLALATTVSGGEGTKTVLGAILTAVKGANTSIDKNFFREKTSEAIIAAIRTARIERDNGILKKLGAAADRYTLEEAWNDLVDLYYAGTLASGFQKLAETTSARADQADREKSGLEKERAVDAKERRELRRPPTP